MSRGIDKIKRDIECDGDALVLLNDLQDMVEEIELLRTQLAAVRESVGPFFCVRYDADGNETSESIYADQGVHVLANAYRLNCKRLVTVENEKSQLQTKLIGAYDRIEWLEVDVDLLHKNLDNCDKWIRELRGVAQ